MTPPTGRIREFSMRVDPGLAGNFRVSIHRMTEVDIVKTTVLKPGRPITSRNMISRIVMLLHDAIWVDENKNAKAPN
jgi:hypothetical protein